MLDMQKLHKYSLSLTFALPVGKTLAGESQLIADMSALMTIPCQTVGGRCSMKMAAGELLMILRILRILNKLVFVLS